METLCRVLKSLSNKLYSKASTLIGKKNIHPHLRTKDAQGKDDKKRRGDLLLDFLHDVVVVHG